MRNFRSFADILSQFPTGEAPTTTVDIANVPQATMPDHLAMDAQDEAIAQTYTPAPKAAPAPVQAAPKSALEENMARQVLNKFTGITADGTMAKPSRSPATQASPEVEETPETKQKNELGKLELLMQKMNEQRKAEIQDAQSRQMKANMLKGLTDNVGLIVGGAQAMNTKANVTPAKVSGFDPGDLSAIVERKYKPEHEQLMAEYKALKTANDPLTAYQMAMIQNMQAQNDLSRDRMAQDWAKFGESEARRQSNDLDRKVVKVGDKLGNVQDVLNSLGNIEDKLGFPLDSAEVEDGTIKVDGKAKDLPGFSMPGIGRVSAHSGDARMLNAAMSKVFNTELKDRSGSAVTSPELMRLKDEFAAGKFNTESEMIAALKDYKNLVAMELRNREAGLDPQALNEYKSRGGATSDKILTNPAGQTKVIGGVKYVRGTVNGKTGWVKAK